MVLINLIPSSKYIFQDILPTYSHSNVVYKIRCLQCSASYVGQTRRLLKIRIDEHTEVISEEIQVRILLSPNTT